MTGPVRRDVTGRRGIRDTRCRFTASAAGAVVRNQTATTSLPSADRAIDPF
jgi:hypothetical protein